MESLNNNNVNVSINNEKPAIVLPGNGVTYNDTAENLCRVFNRQPEDERLFSRGGIANFIETDRRTGEQILKVLHPCRAKSEFERVATLVKRYRRTVKGEIEFHEAPDVCSDNVAKGIMESAPFKEGLPSINLVTSSPVIVRRENGKCEIVEGFDEASGILAKGNKVERVPLGEAVELLKELVQDFDFQSESDKSRALANIITPALVFGGILNDRVPIAMVEADKSQAGKGFLNKLITTIYNETASIVTQRNGGVGGFDESFDTALVKGKPFVSFDNLRGKVDSPALESFMTEFTHIARVPNCAGVEIDPRRYLILATSNNFAMTRDLANRVNVVRIRKRSMDYRYMEFSEGNVLDHVMANQSKYLGAVFAVVTEWCNRGCPKTSEYRHDRKTWAKCLDWIVQNLFGCAPLLDGHQEAQMCMSSPQYQWFREVCLAIKEFGYLDNELMTEDISEVLAHENVELPGARGSFYDELDEKAKQQVWSQVGRKLSSIFKNLESNNVITFGDFVVERRIDRKKFASGKTAPVNTYVFSVNAPMEMLKTA